MAITKDIEVEVEIELSDVLDWIRCEATSREIKEVRVALKEEARNTEDGPLLANPSASVMEQLATKQLNEFLQMQGNEEAMRLINAAKSMNL